MKITKRQLKKIIKEEREKLMNEVTDSAGNYIGLGEELQQELFFHLLDELRSLAERTANRYGLTASEVVDEIKFICREESVESILEN